MKHVATEVGQFLEDSEIGELETDIFIDAFPDEKNFTIGVFTTGGPKPDIYLPQADPKFMVLVRDKSAEDAWNVAESISALLHQKFNSTLVDEGNYYYSILLMGEINGLGRDKKKRIEYSINFQTKIRER